MTVSGPRKQPAPVIVHSGNVEISTGHKGSDSRHKQRSGKSEKHQTSYSYTELHEMVISFPLVKKKSLLDIKISKLTVI